MSLFLRIIQHLLPSGEAFRTVVDKLLRRFFAACATIFENAELYAANSYLDLFPETTRLLEQWEEHFGLLPSPNATENDRRLALAAEWRATGGQSPAYIQGVIQAAGFDLYLHEWWMSFADWDPIIWFRADDPEAVLDGTTFASLPNRGSQGGTVIPAVGLGPEVLLINGKRVGRTTINGGFKYGTASSLTILHEPGTSCAIGLLVIFEASTVQTRLIATKGASATARGMILYLSSGGTLFLAISDGTTNTIISGSGAMPIGVPTSIIVTKQDTLYSLYVNGALYLSGTAALGAGSSDILSVGSTTSDTTIVPGSIGEMFVVPRALSAVEIDRAHRRLNRFATDLVGYVARDPFEWTDDPLAGTVQCGEDLAECADLDPPECDDFLANEPRYFENLVLTDRAPPGIPEDTDAHAYFLYFGGPKFGEFVLVPATRRAQLERLVQKLKPSQQWVVMLVYYYDDNIVVDESGFVVVEDDGSVVVAA